MISIVILTKNEEENLASCVDSIPDPVEVVVLDSFSEDRTSELAERLGVRFEKRPFDDFAGQRNFALERLELSNDWVFFLDADERMTPELWRQCLAVAADDERSGYQVPAKTIFMGRWLRWAATYPVYQVRLVKRGELRFVQRGHGQREGRALRGIGRLEEPYLHHSFSKGLTEWISRHNVYSTQEAQATSQRFDAGPFLRPLFSSDPTERRRTLLRLSLRLPCRGLLRFVYMYFVRFGFLDGRAGYLYCRLLMLYESMISVKLMHMSGREPPSRVV